MSSANVLPMIQFSAKVIDIVTNHQHSIILGATGSGKTTQVPQIIVDHETANGMGGSINIICTQPRRLAAVSIAHRVASERGEEIGRSVGYHIRGDKSLPKPGGSITYCTAGILLRQLQNSSDEIFDNTSHIIVDEVHERSLRTDFLLTMLKQALEIRRKAQKPVPKLVLMSATVDPTFFSTYLEYSDENREKVPCPWLEVPGRLYPVKEFFLEDLKAQLVESYTESDLAMLTDRETIKYTETERRLESDPLKLDKTPATVVPLKLMAATIAHVAKTTTPDGAILAFLPGLAQIKALDLLLMQEKPLGVDFADTSKFKVCLIHSGLGGQQWEAFSSVPAGCRKVIISTNIAETSITIPDVQHVIDSGKHREYGYNHASKMSTLSTVWISKSNAKQRAGRAGRVQKGNYYALFSRARLRTLQKAQTPEIHRSDLQEICLQIKSLSLQIPIRDFLAAAPDPPLPSAVDAAVEALQQLDALDRNEELTSLGWILSTLPLHPSLGKMVVMGITFRCFDALLLLSAAVSGKGIFTAEISKEQRSIFGPQSDHVATINAFREARTRNQEGGHDPHYLSPVSAIIKLDEFEAIDRTMRQIEETLVSIGLLPYTEPSALRDCQLGPPHLNENSDNINLIKALAVSCLPGHISAMISPHLLRSKSEDTIITSPHSINGYDYRRQENNTENWTFGNLFLYSEIAKMDNQKVLRDTTLVSPLMVALFGGSLSVERSVKTSTTVVKFDVDEWIPFRIDKKNSYTILDFRESLDKVISTSFRNLFRSQGKAKNDQMISEKMDAARKSFVDHLVQVLQSDATMRQNHQENVVRARSEMPQVKSPSDLRGHLTTLGSTFSSTHVFPTRYQKGKGDSTAWARRRKRRKGKVGGDEKREWPEFHNAII